VSSVQADPQHWLLIEVANIYNARPEEKETKFKIIPNPARGKVNIQFSSPVGNYSLYLADSLGKILAAKESTAQREEININHFSPGIYFIIIKEGNAIHQAKFIIN